jgi:hypothetical protein
VIKLSEKEWSRLYKEAAVLAARMTHTRDPKQQFTARDRAQEALQRACERMLNLQPESVTSYEAARDYLAAATRSELYNAGIRAGVRRETEKEAVVEQATTTGAAALSPEQMQLEAAIRSKERKRADRMLELTRDELAGDRIALGTIDCLVDEKDAPDEQAIILDVPVVQIYLARERRMRAMKRALAHYLAETKDVKEEP